MVTTGTYAFNPSAADVVLNAFGMVGKRRTQIDYEMLENAGYQAQMVGVDFTNKNPNRWQMETVEIPMLAEVATYTLAPQVVAVSFIGLDNITVSPVQTRALGILSAVDYAAQSNKTQPGVPTSYFFSLSTPNPTLTFWPVPIEAGVYVAKVQVFKQQQDVRLDGGFTLDSPYRFLDAYTFGLAARLAIFYPDPNRPTLAADLNTAYEAKFRLAAGLDQERVAIRIQPGLSSYFRA
jgi:hypothetical protein